MLVTALLMLIGVACFGTFILKMKIKKQAVGGWMITGHGIGAALGLIALVIGLFESYSADTLNQWNLIALGLVLSVVCGSFILFKKWLKGKRKPLALLLLHGVLAGASVGVLTYSVFI